MKRFYILLSKSLWFLILIAFSSCSKGWNRGELELITGDVNVSRGVMTKDIMRVLCIADEKDSLVLRGKSECLTDAMIRSELYSILARKMVATVTDPAQGGVGIAGPQVGILRRIVAVQRFDKPGEPFEVYPNIRITDRRGTEELGFEGCLSVPDRYDKVSRSRDITIRYTSPATLCDTLEHVIGFTAVIFQHECDHLDGIVFTDRIRENGQ